jgi:WD40 repeat protein
MTSCVCVSPDGTQALSAGPEAAPCLWDGASGKRLARLQGSVNKKDPPHVVAFSPDGRFAISAHDRKVWLWDLAAGKELYWVEREGLRLLFSIRLPLDGGCGKPRFKPDRAVVLDSSPAAAPAHALPARRRAATRSHRHVKCRRGSCL